MTYSPTPPAGDTSSAILAIRNLSVEVAGAGSRVVRNLSLDVHAGETVCVVGESGSGKSVTSLAVMGLLPQGILKIGAGSIRVEGEDVATATPRRLRELRATRMAMVFQEPMTALNPVHTVGKQVDEVLRLHRKMSAAERRAKVLEMFRSVHLPDVERIYDAYPHQLSGGQRQRIVIAMALILEPRLLIADEPTTALDVTTQKQILALIKELQVKHKTAVLFITHDFGVVAEISDRIIVMNRGDLVESGTRHEILAEPKQSYTRRLVSSVPSLVPSRREAPAGQPVLHVKGLGRTYGGGGSLFSRKPAHGVVAAADVNLTLRKGEILGIVGESGSGKSTIGKCLLKLVGIDGGQLLFNGQDIAAMPESRFRPMRKDIQMIFQDPFASLNPRHTVGRIISDGPRANGVPQAAAEARARELLALVGLEPSAFDRYPNQFSGGQRQRVGIARALALEPKVLVADESVSALDVSVQAQVLELLRELQQRLRIALVFITHDLRVAAQICDAVLVMHRGKVVEHGTPSQIFDRPQHAYTRQLIAAVPGQHWDPTQARAQAA
ncbi:ABC transporter ATP-binding protein [Achromobacter sp. Marseille-Q0513]|uniref:ABC transporter ATP-binding protein n=1 Tax=Achromobacter sp. Marseille-Q0513 TaxID=2829161 RepID=UPI001B8DB3A5|nr:ABC transporter ATP-binding protein [Achromobacter sp. Marseille-Q0513]MBR8653618.1 ABC transporter ATP-binding protein [Achromobacter sp. Marseille-Q0513]